MFGNWSGRPPFRTLTPDYRLLTPPSAEPMSVVEAKQQMRRALDITTEDSLIQRMIEGARNQVEVDTCRAIVYQRWMLLLDRWPDKFEFYKCPLRQVELVEYLDLSGTSGTWQTVDPLAYTVSYSEPARLDQSYAHYWLPSRFQMSSIRVTFTAGYLIPFTVSASTLSFQDYIPTNGDSFRLTNSGGSLPSPLKEKTTYYVVGASGNTCQLSLTSGGAAISLTDPGVGLHYFGEVPQSLMNAMRKRVACEFADREGSEASAKCEQSYLQSLRPAQYTVL